jgi:hypothetical protein
VPFGHLGDGNIHYNISQPPGMDKARLPGRWEEVNAAVHEIVLDLGGSISAEHGIGRMKRDLLPMPRNCSRARSDAQDQGDASIRTAFSIPGSLSRFGTGDRNWDAIDDYIAEKPCSMTTRRSRRLWRRKRSGRPAADPCGAAARQAADDARRDRWARARSWRSARSAATAPFGSRGAWPMAARLSHSS